MFYLILIFIIFYIFTIIKSFLRFLNSRNFILNKNKTNKTYNKKIDIIIPVYNEVKNIKSSVSYFKKFYNCCNVYYVTTSKEKSSATYNKLIEEIKRQKTKNIYVDNCPNIIGTMANQLNYMAKKLEEESIIAIYNVDSRPTIDTFKYVIDNINDREVYQQVSYFDDKNSGIINSCQMWQNRWSIIYEMGKYISNINYQFKYTIGHGLFIKKCILDKYGYWSEQDINEDNELGYRLLINGIKIKGIPFLEKADFANNIKIYIKQQSTWVNGPLYAFKYFKNNEKNFKNLVLSVLNFKAFISWWLFPIIILLFIFLSLFYQYYTLALIIFLLTIIYVSGLNGIVNKLLIKTGHIKNCKSNNIFNDLIFFVIHCFGPFITINKIIHGKNNIQNKYNTEK
ncbi:MAG: glycosyltransferase family 2 protein [Firmicutes bacterium]|nr:glycosyltransferase family 2 protein [Bacillota bacterium]